MRFITAVLGLAFSLSFAVPASADVDEFIRCKLNDGKTMADFMKVVDGWRAATDAAGFSDYSAEILVPIYAANIQPGGFAWHGTAPNMMRMGEAQAWYLGTDWGAKFAKVSSCADRSLYGNP